MLDHLCYIQNKVINMHLFILFYISAVFVFELCHSKVWVTVTLNVNLRFMNSTIVIWATSETISRLKMETCMHILFAVFPLLMIAFLINISAAIWSIYSRDCPCLNIPAFVSSDYYSEIYSTSPPLLYYL